MGRKMKVRGTRMERLVFDAFENENDTQGYYKSACECIATEFGHGW